MQKLPFTSACPYHMPPHDINLPRLRTDTPSLALQDGGVAWKAIQVEAKTKKATPSTQSLDMPVISPPLARSVLEGRLQVINYLLAPGGRDEQESRGGEKQTT